MPTTRGTRQKNATATTYASVCLSAGRGVESARNREARNLPTLKTCQTILALALALALETPPLTRRNQKSKYNRLEER